MNKNKEDMTILELLDHLNEECWEMLKEMRKTLDKYHEVLKS